MKNDLRPRDAITTPQILRVNQRLALDLSTGQVRYRGRTVTLRPIDAALLATLMRRPGRVVSFQELIDEHWGGWASRSTVSVRISRLRRALGRRLIHTVPGVGVQLNALHRGAVAERVSLQSGDLQLHARTMLLRNKSAEGRAYLTPLELRLVSCLMRHVGRVVPNERLARICGTKHAGSVVYAMVGLRRKLRRIHAAHTLVAVGGGYRLGGEWGRVRRMAGFELDLHERTARMRGRPVAIWPRWVPLLELLTAAPGTTVSRRDLLASLWGAQAPHESLDSTIGQIRIALGDLMGTLIVKMADGYRLDVERFGLVAVGPLLLDPASRCVRLDDGEVQLAAESVVLELLMKHAGTLLTAAQIVDELDLVSVNALRHHVKKLRAKLGPLFPQTPDAELIPGTRWGEYRLALEPLGLEQTDWPLQIADLQLHPTNRRLRCNGRVGDINPQPAKLLELLILGDGRAAIDAVIDAIWAGSPKPNAVRGCQAWLQRTLDEAGARLTVGRQGDQLRLVPTVERHEILRIDDILVLDLTTGEVWHRGRPASLGPIEADVLALLIHARDRVAIHQELVDDNCPGRSTRGEVQSRIRRLRDLLGRDLIRSVPGIGYQLTVGRRTKAARRVVLRSGSLELEVGTMALRHGNSRHPVYLTPHELEVVACLIRHVGRVVSRHELAHAGGVANADSVVDNTIVGVRSKLRELRAEHLLVTVGDGYRLAAGSARLRRIAGLELDLDARTARMDGRLLEIARPQYALLELLSAAPGTTVSRDALVAHAWKGEAHDTSLATAILELRSLLGEELLEARGDGYRLAIWRFELIAVGPLLLDPASRCVRLDDGEVQLAAESVVLELLMKHAGTLLTRERIVDELGLVSVNALKHHVKWLRAKLRLLLPQTAADEVIVSTRWGAYGLALEPLGLETEWPLQIANLQFHPTNCQLRCDGRVVDTSPQPAKLLELLILGGGSAAIDAVIDAIWSGSPRPEALRKCQGDLQKALKQARAGTVQRRGDKLHLVPSGADPT